MSERARIRRPREVNTCRECRLRKVKCDCARPTCSRCVQLGVDCVYGENARAADTTPAAAPAPVPTPGASSSSHSVTDSSRAAVREDVVLSAEARLESLNRLMRSMQQQHAATDTTRSTLEPSATSSPKRARYTGEGREDEPELGPRGEHLSIQSGGRTKYVSGYYWASICDEVAKLDELLQSQNRYDVVTTEPPTIVRQDSFPSVATPQTNSQSGMSSHSTASPTRTNQVSEDPGDLFAQPRNDEASLLPPTVKHQRPVVITARQMPTEDQRDYLVQVFVQCYQPLAPVLHVPTFLQDYEDFRAGLAARPLGYRVSPPFLALLCAVLFASSVISSSIEWHIHFPDASRSQMSGEFYRKAVRALRMASFARAPSIESFAAYLIVHSVWEREEEPLMCSSFVGVAVRLAQMLGLNKDPAHFPKLHSTTAEWRRRLAWQLHYYDVTIAIAAGLPPLIDDGSWDVRLPSEAKDELIGTYELLQYESDLARGRRPPMSATESSLVSAAGVFARAKFNCYVIVKRVIARLFTQRPLSGRDVRLIWSDMEELRSDLLLSMKRLPTPSRAYGAAAGPAKSSWATNEALVKFAQTSIASMYARVWGYFYTPLMHGTMTTVWPDLRRNIVLFSRRFLTLYINLALDEDFHPFQWSWPGKYQPLRTLMVLIRDVEIHPFDSDSAVSRNMVDETLALCGPAGNGITYYNGTKLVVRTLTAGGSEAWSLIWSLRARAWTKAGADPDILLTREEVYERGRDRYEQQSGFYSDENVADPGGHADLRERLAAQRERGIAVLEGRLPVSELQPQYTGGVEAPLPPVLPRASEDMVLGEHTAPNYEWTEWEHLFDGEGYGGAFGEHG